MQLDAVLHIISEKGPLMLVSMSVGRYMVPRLYIALHGVRPSEILELAKKYGWEAS